ncbi:glycosyltransferase [Jiangella mangrovi]|uniref:UDP:flavonoid glycosyltransferase YjiC (YdhE family) n=1 Tax=Jiangella mangrovi TaxID=1524084 RepID=A0A7W9GT21_9ACTN|nr:nucleotide disphospho-sugar-binding domain-containing protein [Jiangella mangrovi]MBB5789529.1 UDP:flavonoid glycosyltransferase YjiC (YdhE family) [Jiangella mangrovi]
MATFLIASIAIEAHTTNPLPVAARLVERGHTVLWYAGRAFHERIARTSATPLPYVDAPDFSGQDFFEYFPQFRGRSGPKVIGDAFAQVFVGHAPQRVADLRRITAAHPVDAMLTEGLSYGVGMVSELEGIPWATFADGPLPFEDPDTPPFGPGLLPMRGPAGRLRNRLIRAAAGRLIFRDAERVYDEVRAGLGLPPDPGSALQAGPSPLLHLQACTPSFEYPRRHLPAHIHWIGALRPDPRPWDPPAWWDELGVDGVDGAGRRPVVHVTQGSLRPDPAELVLPAVRGLADEPVTVVVTTGGASRADLERAAGEPLPANCLVMPWIPYDELLARADVFVTNGGYTGVTLALAHGVPIVQAGTTEEKAENAARIQWSGVGLRLGKTHPAPSKVRAAVRRVLDEPSFRTAARRVQAEMSAHDAAVESAELLERLAATRRPVLRADADERVLSRSE